MITKKKSRSMHRVLAIMLAVCMVVLANVSMLSASAEDGTDNKYPDEILVYATHNVGATIDHYEGEYGKPEKPGKIFAGWYYSHNDSQAPSRDLNVQYDTTLISKWIDVGTDAVEKDAADCKITGKDTYNDFDLMGAQIKREWHKTIQLTDNRGWENTGDNDGSGVFAYFYDNAKTKEENDELFGAWPGKQMRFYRKDGYDSNEGRSNFVVEIPEGATHVIFNGVEWDGYANGNVRKETKPVSISDFNAQEYLGYYTSDDNSEGTWINIGENGSDKWVLDIHGYYDYNYDDEGLRFVSVISESLLGKLKGLNKNNDTPLGVRYGYYAGKTDTIAALDIDTIDKYDGNVDRNNVEGDSTGSLAVLKADCTSRVDNFAEGTANNHGRVAEDHFNSAGYRQFTLLVTYQSKYTEPDKKPTAASVEEKNTAMNTAITARAYIEYEDANGNVRTYCNTYSGTNSFGGCSASFTQISGLMN